MVLRLILGQKHKRTLRDWLLDGVIILGVAALAWWRWSPPF